MAKRYRSLYFIAILVAVFVSAPPAVAFTDLLDVVALRDLYKTLNQPPQLKGWRLDGGNPCDESWDGVSCFGSSVIYLELNGLNLSGYITPEIYNLYSLKQLDISSNSIGGEIPYVLPPNATHINMAYNHLIQNIPPSLPGMKSLRHLNLSHNLLSGPIGNVFTGLQNLREMDLSYNNFTGDLPSSFGSLTNLTGLYLQNNKFTGSVAYLAELPLIDLNIKDNYFSGIIPSHFQSIPNLWIGGNSFHLPGDNYPPWNFPLETQGSIIESNIHPPPATQSSAMEKSNPSTKLGGHKKRTLGPGGIAFMIGGGTLVASCVALYIAHRIKQSIDSPMSAREESPPILTLRSPILLPRRLPPVYHSRVEKSRKKSFSDKSRFPVRIKLYTVAELQSATNSFMEEKFLGQGSLGSVYKAEFPDGQISVVKNMKMSGLSFHEEEKFLDLVWTLSRLKHPNIVPLLGYCVEHGQHLLVYEYVRNISLDEALHSDAYKALSWGLRLQIALGVAQALDYLHSTLSPPVGHGNLKSANILLDEELAPHICDCGLAILRPLTSNSLKLKASEDAIGDTGYIAPEHGLPGFDNTKSDVYAFGVLLLELLTGRKPSDSSKPREEQSLVKWASLRLHDYESLEEMIDPGIRKTCSSKALSNFADIISLCIQPVKEFRPPMSEVVGSLTQLMQKLNMGKGNGADGTQVDPFERSFRSTNTRFMGSPTLSYFSV
ncbi:PREDICTED: protein STRUBBELIG-RECEPTOR FAMILY 2-like [Fragaria vesca subsp. vesca]